MRYAVCELSDSIYTFTHTFALSFPERRRANNMANQSKMQLSLLDMEQRELLLIAVAHEFMQLKTHNKRRKHRSRTSSMSCSVFPVDILLFGTVV